MTNERHSLTRTQCMVIAQLVKESIDCVMLPGMPEKNVHEKASIRFNELNLTEGTDEEITLWVPSAGRASSNPPVLRRFTSNRKSDREKLRNHEAVTFPDAQVTYHVITVDELKNLHSYVRQFEEALSETPSVGLGIPVEWWFGPEDETESTYRTRQPSLPLCFRFVDLISSPVKTAEFNRYDERFQALNIAFEVCWDFLQSVCATSPIEGAEERYDVDPFRYARILLDGNNA
ncbi:MAG TPA: hypothetical protein VFX19_12830 [Dehalococcoidia bacterium]|nr:hypothetical protein [Dehalococcoidia bacterium]